MTDACEDCGTTGRGAVLVTVDVDGAQRTLCGDCAAPQPCERCGRLTSTTTLAGTFRCRHCSNRPTHHDRRTHHDQRGLGDFGEAGGGA